MKMTRAACAMWHARATPFFCPCSYVEFQKHGTTVPILQTQGLYKSTSSNCDEEGLKVGFVVGFSGFQFEY